MLKKNDLIKANLLDEKKIHIEKAGIFYSDLKNMSKEAKTNPTLEVLSFDYQQNMPLPHIPSGDVFYKRQVWSYNFCIYSGKTGQSYFFMYDESVGKKGQNEVISFLNYYLENLLHQGIQTLYLFADNCSSQNKNTALIHYLYTIIQSEAFGLKQIIQRYPEPGHSFLPCDRCFGLIEQQKRKIERVYIPSTYQEMVKNTCVRRFNVINVTQRFIYNFSEYLKPYFKKCITNSSKAKFTIMAYRQIEYKKEGLFCTTIPHSTSTDHFILHKSVVNNFKYPMENLPTLYSKPLQIKRAKLLDVQDLAAKYVPPEHLWFYNQFEENYVENNDVPCLSNYED